jgi:hypothetical protein
VVKLMYRLSIDNNLGCRAIAAYLNENGIRTCPRSILNARNDVHPA